MEDNNNLAKRGIILAISAYTMWGIAPIYFKSITSVPPLEILSHRVIWSFFFLALIIAFSRQWVRVKAVLTQPKTLFLLTISALLVGCNWLIFIWAVNNNHLLDASLGYYINPLLNVLLGMLLLGERLRRLQWAAVLIAAIGVIAELIQFGSLPWIAFALATSFGFYGLLRKKINIDAQTGLFIETFVLLPLAAIYLFFISSSPTANLTDNSFNLNLLLVAAGIVTTLPLLCFTGAATKLKLSTLGFLQYIGPSLMFILATFIYQEPFKLEHGITFGCIWLALLLFSIDGIRSHQQSSNNKN
ncbi:MULTISPECIES: EamA family transporter RarD [unclassified Photobacterium]|uniref:EamA family transporter RarD n=1 Tax=unclassified Photobacterium TaxID=2628852 RepID=UPI000D1519B9|nr:MULTISPECIES: EamA family transporter RarD [unclassified Photobacterium]PSV24808.1 EamA family transporter RarD [Photobacterium sp. GB-56]PSV42327.1 EamA family transporter RarD [Photobacterium sp. GB-36]PSV51595.1 EamA family transporter RarD [Photobacterium sp. GB-1]PSW72393.1 EamA family transporter RarD [Photobacterium sp. GB-50]